MPGQDRASFAPRRRTGAGSAPDARSAPPAQDSAGSTNSHALAPFRLGHKEVAFSHLDRVFFPEMGYTKADLLAYYLDIAPYLLPHVKDRPLTLERWPEGVEDGSFFQKDAASYFPEWIKTFPMERKDHQKVVHYPLVADTADLLYLVNQGTLTFHTWLSRSDDWDHPDLMVLDVDPPEDPESVGFASVGMTARSPADDPPFRRAVEVAVILRDQLQAAGFDPVVKTSGKRGLHLAFKLAGHPDHGEARAQLVDIFARAARKHPRLLTTEIRKNKRGGRVYLDALRMSAGATIVPPYVVRPTPTATVSMPVTWSELERLEDGRPFTIKTAPSRLNKIGDLWAGLLRGGTRGPQLTVGRGRDDHPGLRRVRVRRWRNHEAPARCRAHCAGDEPFCDPRESCPGDNVSRTRRSRREKADVRSRRTSPGLPRFSRRSKVSTQSPKPPNSEERRWRTQREASPTWTWIAAGPSTYLTPSAASTASRLPTPPWPGFRTGHRAFCI